MAARATVPFVIHNGNHWTEWNAIWSNIIRVISKSDAERELDLKSQVWFPTEISRHEFQLPLYYSHFELAESSQYQYFIDLVTSLSKNGNKKAFKSHFVFETEIMRYRAKMLRFKTEMTWFRTNVS